jgi:uncharacterized protein YbbK (DUF523 family)
MAVRVAISSCLLGARVRYDGGHKLDSLLVDALGGRVEWVPVCPEVEAGFGTPREPMRLERAGTGLRLLTTRTRRDVTAQLTAYADARVDALAAEQLSGYVFKAGSPSCGLSGVTVVEPDDTSASTGRGLFAERLVRRFPFLPVEEERGLLDPCAREAFLVRVLAYHAREYSG